MVLDHRGGYLETARLWMGAVVNPVYVVVQAPFDFWNWLTGSFADRARLRAENEQLTEELRVARIKLLQFDSLNEENRRLRAIRQASGGVAERTLIAEIIRVDMDPFRQRVRIDKGADDGVFRGQPIVDAFGVVGQVVQVDKYTSTLILISDTQHAIPVQVNRNGIRSIAVGTGEVDRLRLPYLTIESDVRAGDLLVSSGLDDIFPAGYPVAIVTRVERDPNETFALVEAKPLAQLDRDREVLLLWTDELAPQGSSPVQEPSPASQESSPPPAPSPAPQPSPERGASPPAASRSAPQSAPPQTRAPDPAPAVPQA
jgi:rod shape-determining protein MreC